MQRNRRHDRVRELLKRAVGEVIREMFSIQEVGVVSVTDVGISNDLRSAVVFLSFTAEDRRKAFGKIQENVKAIRMAMSQKVVLKYTPEIRFQIDDSVEKGNHILDILDQLEREGLKPESSEDNE